MGDHMGGLDPMGLLKKCYDLGVDLWDRYREVAENARLSGQLEDGVREQLSYIGILHDIMNATPDVQDKVCEIFECLERVYMRTLNDIRKLRADCDQGGALARLSCTAMAHEVAKKLMDILDWTDRQSLRLLTMGHFLHAAESLRQAAIHRQVAPFNTEGLPAGHMAGSLLNSVIAERRRTRPAAQQPSSARRQHGSPQAQQQGSMTQSSGEIGLQQPQSPAGSESADVLPSQEEFGELLRQSQVPPADVHSFVQRAALLASDTKVLRREDSVKASAIERAALQRASLQLESAGSGAAAGGPDSNLLTPQLQEFAEQQAWLQQAGLQQAEGLNLEGNGKYKQGLYPDAISCYERAVALLQKLRSRSGEADRCPEALPLVKACFLNKSICHLKLGEFDDCIRSSTTLLDIDPSDYKARYRRGVARLEFSMHEGADARRSLQLGVNDLRACLDSAPPIDQGYVRAKLQSGVNQLDEATNAAEEEKLRRLQDARVMQTVGDKLFGDGNWEFASKSFANAIGYSEVDEGPENRAVVRACSLKLALCHLELGESAECIRRCTSVLSVNAYEWEALAYWGQAQLRSGNATCAATDLGLALKLAPRHLPSDMLRRVSASEQEARAQINSSAARSPQKTRRWPWEKDRKKNEKERAVQVEVQRKAQKAREAEQAPRLDLAQHKLADGNILFSRKQYRDAGKTFSQALRHLNERDTLEGGTAVAEQCHVQLGLCAFELGRYDVCVYHCTCALALAPYSSNALYWRGLALQKVNNLEHEEAAIRDLALAARLMPAGNS